MAIRRWSHVPTPEVAQKCMSSLDPPGELSPPKREGGPWTGTHKMCGKSKSGNSFLVWGDSGYFECGKCAESGFVVDLLMSFGKVGGVSIPTVEAAETWLRSNYGEAQYEWGDPVPFDPIHGPEWPSGVLPPEAEQWVQELSKNMQVPLSFTASVLLGCVSAVASPKARIRIGGGHDIPEPLNLWIMPALDSGERKTPPLKEGTAPIRVLERQLQEEQKVEIAEAKALRSLLEKRLKAAEAKAVGGVSHE